MQKVHALLGKYAAVLGINDCVVARPSSSFLAEESFGRRPSKEAVANTGLKCYGTDGRYCKNMNGEEVEKFEFHRAKCFSCLCTKPCLNVLLEMQGSDASCKYFIIPPHFWQVDGSLLPTTILRYCLRAQSVD